MMRRPEKLSVLVSGAAGYTGSRLVSKLACDYAVAGLVRDTSDLRSNSSIPLYPVAPDFSNLTSLFAEIRPDVVVHLATVSRAGESATDVIDMIDANVKLPALLLALLRQHGGKCFFNIGSNWQTSYGRHYSPFNVYAATKQCCEDIIQYYAQNGVAAITLRLYEIYGPGDWRPKIFNYMLRAAVEATPLDMSPGFQKMFFIHVADIISAIRLMIARLHEWESGHSVYSLRPAEPISLRDLAAIMEEITRMQLRINWGRRSYRQGEIMNPDTSLPVLPGWSQKVNLIDGIRECYQAMAAERDCSTSRP